MFEGKVINPFEINEFFCVFNTKLTLGGGAEPEILFIIIIKTGGMGV
jgi:hypothetical protein